MFTDFFNRSIPDCDEESSTGLETVYVCDNYVDSSITQIDSYSYVLTICVWDNEGGIPTNPCIRDCSTETISNDPCDYGSSSYNEEECNGNNNPCEGITCPYGYVLTENCNCKEEVQPCPNTCGEGYYKTSNCDCVALPPPPCSTSCPSGYELVNCNCIRICPTSCPAGYTLQNCNCVFTQPPPDEPCDQAATAAGIAGNNLMNNSVVQNSLNNFPAFLPQGSNQQESLFTINNINGTIGVTSTQTGTSTNVNSTNGYTSSTIADVHLHVADGYAVPSAQDIFALDNKRDQISNFTASYVKAHDGNLYALYIEDASKFNTFINNNTVLLIQIIILNQTLLLGISFGIRLLI